MSLDGYFLSPAETMPPRKKPSKTEGAASSIQDPEERQIANASNPTSCLDPALRQAIQEITENITKVLDEKLSCLSQTLQTHALRLQNAEKRTDEAEERISGIEDVTAEANHRIKTLEKTVQGMAEHIEELENRTRRKNIRVIGLPEGVEGNQATAFLESWLPEFLRIETKTGRIQIERAYRTSKPAPDRRPRPLLICFHDFCDKLKVLEAARLSGIAGHNLRYDGSKVMFFQDFSPETARRRKRFDEVKKRLKSTGVQYSLLYPAKLRITHNGSSKMFDSPDKAMAFLNELK